MATSTLLVLFLFLLVVSRGFRRLLGFLLKASFFVFFFFIALALRQGKSLGGFG